MYKRQEWYFITSVSTAEKDVADSIIKSGYLRPAIGALKTLNSYGMHQFACLEEFQIQIILWKI